MSTTTSQPEVRTFRPAPPAARLATSLELLLIYAGILLYIWRWQFNHPRTWMVLLAAVLSSHFLHRDKLRDLGLTWHGLEASARLVLPLALALYLPFVIYGFASHTLVVSLPGRRIAVMFANYALWCLFQQYVMQSYFHRRLEGLISSPHRRALLLALMFGAAHIPNPILMIATTLGGFIFAEVFARHRNIWPLALAQAVGGFLIGALSPPALIHNMRVGPGYFTYGLR